MRAVRGALSAVLIAALFAATAIAAATPSDNGMRTFVTLHVNTLDQGETVAIIRGNDVLIPVSTLDQAGVHGFKGTRVTVMGDKYVSLASLAPDVHYTLDTDALVLDVTVAAKHFGNLSLDLDTARPAHVQYASHASTFVNYAATLGGSGRNSLFTEFAHGSGQDVLDSSFTAETGAGLRRGLTFFQMDDRIGELRRVAGDFVASTGDLGGSAFMAGYAWSRAFGLDPYAIHFPLPSFTGAVTTPSTADVYVNGILVRRVDLPPGTFNLNNIPSTNGSATTRVVVTDAYGHSQTYSQNYYASAQNLRKGETDFDYAVGLLRKNEFQPGDSYQGAAATARYSLGVSDSLTTGGRVELTRGMVSGGPLVDVILPVGALHVAASAGSDEGKGGIATSVGYTYTAPRFSAAISELAEGPYYPNLTQRLINDRPISSLSAYVSTNSTSGFSVAAEYFRRVMRDSGDTGQIALIETLPLKGHMSVSLDEERDTSSGQGTSYAVNAILNFGFGSTNVSANARTGSSPDQSVQVSKSSTERYGLTYVASADPADNHSLSGTATYRSPHGDYSIDAASQGGAPFTDALRVNGGFVFIDGGVYATEPVTGAYALVDVPNTPGVRVYLQNQDVGTTDRHGKVLVTQMLPNYGNEVRIDDVDAPLNTSIQNVDQLVAPPDRGGAVVKFEATPVHALIGKLIVLMNGVRVVPSYGQLTLDGTGGHTDSIVGGSGEFYFENVTAGTYKASVEFAKGTCAFSLTAPPDSKMMIDLGTLLCTMP